MDVLIEKYERVDENNQLLSAYRPLPPETLKSLREYYRVGLTATQQDLLRLMRDENDTVNDTVKSFSKTEQTVLAAISSHPDFSYEKLAETCLLSRPTIARTIKALQSREVIRRIGSDKKGHWQIIDK